MEFRKDSKLGMRTEVRILTVPEVRDIICEAEGDNSFRVYCSGNMVEATGSKNLDPSMIDERLKQYFNFPGVHFYEDGIVYFIFKPQVAKYDSHGGDTELNNRSGQEVTVFCPLTDEDADLFDVGPMYRIRFPDGYKTDAFEDELTFLGSKF